MTEYFTVENEEGDRIDRYLAEEMPERSRSYLQKLIKEQYEIVRYKEVVSDKYIENLFKASISKYLENIDKIKI